MNRVIWVALAAFISCSPKPTIVGTWEIVSIQPIDTSENDMSSGLSAFYIVGLAGSEMTFNADGTQYQHHFEGGMHKAGGYSFDASQMTLTLSPEATET